MTTPTPNIYIPSISTSELLSYSNKIVGIQGPPGSGKTASSLTFPNPILALFEKPDLKDLLEMPHLKANPAPSILKFYDTEWLIACKFAKFSPKEDPRQWVSSVHAFKQWVESADAKKLTVEQTLVVDNWTRLSEQHDKVNFAYDTLTKDGKIDSFAPWDRKITISEDICNALHGLSCNVVVLFHEFQERDKNTGQLLEKLQPLQQGKFITKLKSYYPNFFRMRCIQNKETKEPEWFWQVKSSDNFDAKCSKQGIGPLVKAEYNSII